MKNSKKILAIVLAIAMLFALSMTAFADGQGIYSLGGSSATPTSDPDCSSYLMTVPAATDTATVTFIFEAADELEEWEGGFYDEFTITLGVADNQLSNYKLSEALYQITTTNSHYTFYCRPNSGSPTGAFAEDSRDLTGVEHDGVLFQPGPIDLWGWVFRINDLTPVESGAIYDIDGFVGTTIDRTYIQDGDVIHFYFDYPFEVYSFEYTADYIRIVPTNVSSSAVAVQLQSNKNTGTIQIVNNQQIVTANVNSYSAFTESVLVEMYSATNLTGNPVASGWTNALGQVTLTGTFAAGTYVLKTENEWLSDNEGDPLDLYDCLLSRTSGYKAIVIG